MAFAGMIWNIPDRIWAFVIVYVAFALAVISNQYLDVVLRKNKYALLCLLIFISSLNGTLADHNGAFHWSERRDRFSKEIAFTMMKNEARSCYLNFDYFKPLLEYYYKTENKNIKISMSNPKSFFYKAFDTKDDYDSVVWDRSIPLPASMQNYALVFESRGIRVYMKKSSISRKGKAGIL